MRYISVFSGIEAASVAFRPLGWEPVAFSEIDQFPCAVLRERFPGVPNLGDISKVDWKPYRGKVDLVVGGSPCQSFSIAGKREGLKGESGLMYEFIRCVREVRPRWFLWENVPGALSSEHGAAFGQLLHEMADGGGYGCAWRVLDAQFFGVAQRRRRLFLVGRAGNGYREACQVLFEPSCVLGSPAEGKEKRAELTARAGRSPRAAGFCNSAVKAGSIGYEPEQHPTLRAGSNLASTGSVIAIDCATTPKARVDVCHTLRRGGDGGSNDFVTYAFAQNQRREVRLDGGDGQTVGAIPATRSGKQLQGVLTPWDVQSKRIFSENGVSPTISAGTKEGANIQPCVLTMASGQANAEIGEDMCPTQSARQYKDPPIVLSDLNTRGAIDVDVAGTLKVGGEVPSVMTRDVVSHAE